MDIDLNVLMGRNLRRLRDERGLSQGDLARMISTMPQRISGIENGREPMGKDYMERICRALKIRPWEFFREDSTPIVGDIQERQHLQSLREARGLGEQVAEKVLRFERLLIEDERRQSSITTEKPLQDKIKILERQTARKRKKTA